MEKFEYTKLPQSEGDTPIQPPPSTLHSWQPNVQGLRGVAILSVLLFHLWPQRFPHGYLGVDIFFVISGFLMCLLLEGKKPLGLPATLQFYFRRIKRIVPTYLFVLLFTLLLAFFFISPTDYGDLRAEVVKPLLFVANWPDDPSGDDYFAETQGTYFFFLHLWSLSVELQFYLIVPLLVFFLHRTQTKVQMGCLCALAAASFFFQSTASKDVQHMSLLGRIWQFLFGFFAFHLQTVMKEDENADKSDSFVHSCKRLLVSLLRFLLPFVIVFLLSVDFASDRRLNRVLVIAAACLAIGMSAGGGTLTNGLLVLIGNISYSVYLVHYPLFEWRRYEFVEVGGSRASVEIGLLLIGVSLMVGWMVEEVFKRVGALLTDWTRLLPAVAFLYLLIGGCLWGLKTNEVDVKLDLTAVSTNPEEIYAQSIDLFEHPRRNHSLDTSALLRLTRDFAVTAWYTWYCDKRVDVPTAFSNVEEMGRLKDKHCTITGGTGRKTIVIIGNSHTRTYTPGIMHSFKGVYSNITLLYRNGCMFIGGLESQRQYSHCSNERAAILPMLKKWKYPIDILILGIGYTNSDPRLRRGPMVEDSVFREMQSFLSELNKIAREVVIFPQVQYSNGLQEYTKLLTRKLAYGHDLNVFRTPLDFVRKYHSNTKRRIAAVRCSKCLKIDWEELWCDKRAAVCDSVDRSFRLPLFYDIHHPNLLGSARLGHFFRQKYDQWMQRSDGRNETSG